MSTVPGEPRAVAPEEDGTRTPGPPKATTLVSTLIAVWVEMAFTFLDLLGEELRRAQRRLSMLLVLVLLGATLVTSMWALSFGAIVYCALVSGVDAPSAWALGVGANFVALALTWWGVRLLRRPRRRNRLPVKDAR